MKKLRLFLLIFAAALVAQSTNGQAIHELVPYWDFSINPTDWDEFFPEVIDDGAIIYAVTTRIDKSGGTILHIRSLPGTLKGAEGGTYKYHDLVARGDWYWPVDENYEPLEMEVNYVGHLKLIKLGEGKIFSMKVHFLFSFDQDGNFTVKKYVIE